MGNITDRWFLFLMLLFWSLSFVIFVLIFKLFFILLILFLFSFYFHFVNFHYLFYSSFFFFHFIFFFYFISFKNQKKATWPRADIAPEINRDGRGLTYACAAALCYVKRCKKLKYLACTAWKAMKHVLLFIKKHGPRLASFSCYCHLKRPSQKLIFYIMIFE